MTVRRIYRAGFVVLALLTLSTTSAAQSIHGKVELQPPTPGPVYGYSGDIGPQHWGSLSPAWKTCSTGREQSPIDIRPLTTKPTPDLPALHPQYGPMPAVTLNNGHTLEVVAAPGNTLTLGDETYRLAQFHFHAPSEHALAGGAQFPLEVHLVHANADGELSVIGIMIQEGETNAGLPDARTLSQVLPMGAGARVEVPDVVFHPGKLLPESLASYRYRGSLTTPPCDEDVRWIVLTEPIEISPDQMRVLLDGLGNLWYASPEGTNARPTQPLHGREVARDEY